MTALHEETGRRRRTLYVPAPEESVKRAGNGVVTRPSDPPIYRALLHQWAGKGRTLPGHRDPEWARLVTPTVRTGQFGSTIPFSAVRSPGSAARDRFSDPRDPRGGGR